MNNAHIEMIKRSEAINHAHGGAVIRRHVTSLDRLSRIGATLEASGIEYSAAFIAAKNILDCSGAQYYFDFLSSDFNAVVSIMREIK